MSNPGFGATSRQRARTSAVAASQLAETYLCLGRPGDAFAEMDLALRAAPPSEAGQVLAWRGAFNLWLGRYEEALPLLDEACRLDAQCAFCWKAATLLKLGKPKPALELLDLTLERYPLDFEALVWRGEAKRALGRPKDALKDLDRVPPAVGLWALFNRALAKEALKDHKGMRAAFDAIPAFVVAYIRKRTGLPLSSPPAASEMKAVLAAGLSLSHGFRREEYRQAIWMR